MNTTTYKDYLGSLNDLERKNAPEELFHAGDFSLLTLGVKVAVVGSRKASNDGLRRAKAITKALVERDIVVVSGLALGIDTTAHQTAIESGGKTITVLGTPLEKAYPAENKDLLETIKNKHLAVSQFPSGYPFKKSNFPIRNRTMALISDATIIVEASEKSGTKHQGWEALRLGRLVLIMNNVASNPNLTWPKKMIEYGAQVLTRENMGEILDNIPNFTSLEDFAY